MVEELSANHCQINYYAILFFRVKNKEGRLQNNQRKWPNFYELLTPRYDINLFNYLSMYTYLLLQVTAIYIKQNDKYSQ